MLWKTITKLTQESQGNTQGKESYPLPHSHKLCWISQSLANFEHLPIFKFAYLNPSSPWSNIFYYRDSTYHVTKPGWNRANIVVTLLDPRLTYPGLVAATVLSHIVSAVE